MPDYSMTHPPLPNL